MFFASNGLARIPFALLMSHARVPGSARRRRLGLRLPRVLLAVRARPLTIRRFWCMGMRPLPSRLRRRFGLRLRLRAPLFAAFRRLAFFARLVRQPFLAALLWRAFWPYQVFFLRFLRLAFFRLRGLALRLAFLLLFRLFLLRGFASIAVFAIVLLLSGCCPVAHS